MDVSPSLEQECPLALEATALHFAQFALPAVSQYRLHERSEQHEWLHGSVAAERAVNAAGQI